ncbi:helix-turn-helix domain-containing protein [Streptomyces sp. TP-A0874]|uniref:helix-turn-helix domain-containing protein n=1 Tax=Streptomyces sp. TP-A0874 TaxID=549819 RepID=UPI0008530C23|nr:XRE family transcriptional regulator [Streptomyces sp. TP-A0874]
MTGDAGRGATGAAPASARLSEELRGLAARAGLSVTELAARTPYGKASWKGFLDGRKPVPRQAVDALCRLAGENGERLPALWELADLERWGRERPAESCGEQRAGGGRRAPERPGSEPVGEGGAGCPLGGERQVGRRHRTVTGFAVIAAVLGLVLSLATLVWPGEIGGHSVVPAGAGRSAGGVEVGCRGESCDGEDPEVMACHGGAERLDAGRASTAGGLEIRYSADCRAVWALVRRSRAGDRIELSAAADRVQRAAAAVGRVDVEGYLHTPMLGLPGASDRLGLRACLVHDSGAGRECVGVSAPR